MKLLVVRGDLNSSSGYGRITRDLVSLMTEHFDEIWGVDLHPNPQDPSQLWSFRMVSDQDVLSDLNGNLRLTILNFCAPHEYRKIHGALNIGYFVWESPTLNLRLNWIENLSKMDQIWTSANFLAKALGDHGFAGKVYHIPWQQSENARILEPASIRVFTVDQMSSVKIWLLGAINLVCKLLKLTKRCQAKRLLKKCESCFWKVAGRHAVDYQSLRKEYVAFGSVAQVTPRKGLPILVSEWFQFRQSEERNEIIRAPTGLFIKTKQLDFSEPKSFHFYQLLTSILRAKKSFSITNTNLFLLPDFLSNEQMEYFENDLQVFVSASLGEGFGGTAASRATKGQHLIVPSHTAFIDYIHPDYPLLLGAKESRVLFFKNLEIYELSSIWSLLESGSLVRAIRTYLDWDEATKNRNSNLLRLGSVLLHENVIRGRLQDLIGGANEK